jgi:DNA-binding Lrp family transcriptional regulator
VPEHGKSHDHGKSAYEPDDVDRRILKALNEDARKSFRDVARELGLALSTVSNRVKRLEETGIIRGYVPLVDATRLGFDLHVIVGVKIAHGKLIEVQQRIAKNPRVFAVYDVTGEWDSMLIARFRDREDLNSFIKEVLAMPHVERTTTQLVLNTMKEERRVGL